MTQLDAEIFFALLRAAVWTGVDGQPTAGRVAQLSSLVPDGYDWTQMVQAFKDHAMLGIVAHAMMLLPEQKRPGMQQQKICMAYLAGQVRYHHRVQYEIANVFRILQNAGCHPVLLKGMGLSKLYPATCRRPVGDVDIYVDLGEYPLAKHLLADYCGMDEHKAVEDEVHVQMNRGPLEFELHRKPFYPSFSKRKKELLAWAGEQLTPDKCEKIMCGTETIPVPGSFYNVVFVYDHMVKHILYESPSLRQFADLALVLRHAIQNGSMDNERFIAIISKYSSLPLWQMLSGVLHFQLGMDPAEIPAWDGRRAASSQGVFLSHMLQSGNFGRNHEKNNFSSFAPVRKLQHILHFLRFPAVLRREMVKRKLGVYLKRNK